MKSRVGRVTVIKLMAVDVALLIATYWGLLWLQYLWESIRMVHVESFNNYGYRLIFILFAWPFCLYVLDNYSFYKEKKFEKALFKLAFAVLMGMVLQAAFFYLTRDTLFSRKFFILFGVAAFIILGVVRFIGRSYHRNVVLKKKGVDKVLVVGNNVLAHHFKRYVNRNPELRKQIIGYVKIDEEDARTPAGTILGDVDDLVRIMMTNVIDEVVFAVPREKMSGIDEYVQACEEMGITMHMIMDIFDTDTSKVAAGAIGELPVLTFHTITLDEWQLSLKRGMDIIGGLCGVFVTAVVFVFLAPAIYLESPGPIFFGQKRMGRNGRTFTCYKFRSMAVDAEKRKKDLMEQNEMNGAIFKIKDDPRITKVGKFIRAASLDELPQFWNVLKGDMSIVGTRPPTLDEVSQYEPYHWKRLCIKPGITGIWQVSGRNQVEDFEEIVRMDVEYIYNWSLWLDIKLIFKTLQVVFAGRGAC